MDGGFIRVDKGPWTIKTIPEKKETMGYLKSLIWTSQRGRHLILPWQCSSLTCHLVTWALQWERTGRRFQTVPRFYLDSVLTAAQIAICPPVLFIHPDSFSFTSLLQLNSNPAAWPCSQYPAVMQLLPPLQLGSVCCYQYRHFCIPIHFPTLASTASLKLLRGLICLTFSAILQPGQMRLGL